MIKNRIKRSCTLFYVYSLISEYLPRTLYLKKNNAPIFLKMISAFTRQKSIFSFHGSRPLIRLTPNSHFMMRKRKALICDEINGVMLHAFIQPENASEYKKNRDAFVSEVGPELFRFPKYVISEENSPALIIFEEKLPGVSLNKCNQERVDDFIDVWINCSEKIYSVRQDAGLELAIYSGLRNAIVRLKQELSPDSPLFQLYHICGSPFEGEKGVWPISFCHGQTLPANILYDREKNQYCFIDYEPGLMGYAPCAYDIAFFILYAHNLFSQEYKNGLKIRLAGSLRGYKWHQHILAHIVWWSRDRQLNLEQVRKINERSEIALSLIASRGKIL